MHNRGFPLDPYPIQHEFMESFVKCVTEKKIGIFESPTGTVSFPLIILIGENIEHYLCFNLLAIQ